MFVLSGEPFVHGHVCPPTILAAVPTNQQPNNLEVASPFCSTNVIFQNQPFPGVLGGFLKRRIAAKNGEACATYIGMSQNQLGPSIIYAVMVLVVRWPLFCPWIEPFWANLETFPPTSIVHLSSGPNKSDNSPTIHNIISYKKDKELPRDIHGRSL